MVRDLKALNKAIVTRALTVPDPHMLLNDLRPENRYFSVCDINNPFFYIPVHSVSFGLHSHILLHVDDILLAAPTEDAHKQGTMALLQFLVLLNKI